VTTSADLVWDIYAADMDNDGDTDILSASRFGNEISWYENTLAACANLQPITAGALAITTSLNQPINADVIAASTINQGDVIQVAIISQGENGVATINADKTITYTPGAGFLGNDSFEYRITNQCNAVDSDFVSITVNAASIVIYNGVSPNGDNFNPYFRIENIEVLKPENKVTIYNRWGDKVFEIENYVNNDPDKRFNGESDKGKDLPSGVYFYKIEFKDGSPELSGYLTLKR
jgi:gliding motility-associated-like protein